MFNLSPLQINQTQQIKIMMNVHSRPIAVYDMSKATQEKKTKKHSGLLIISFITVDSRD